MRIIFAIPVLALLLAACSTLGPTPEQIKAMEGTGSSMCIRSGPSMTAGAGVDIHYTAVGGKSVGTAGGTAKATCGSSVVEFNNEGRLAPSQPAKVTP